MHLSASQHEGPRGAQVKFQAVVLPNGNQCNALVADNFFARLFGYLPYSSASQKKCPNALLFLRTQSIHTIGMRFSLDVYFCDKDFGVLQTHTNVGSMRFLIGPKGTAHTLEIPSVRSGTLMER